MLGLRQLKWLMGAVWLLAGCTGEPIFVEENTLFACTADVDCASGFVCLTGVCREEGTLLDGGTTCVENAALCKPDAGFD